MKIPQERLQALLDADFTTEELQGIADDLEFAVTLAAGYDQSVTVDAASKVHWTPEKRAAWNALLGELVGRVRNPRADD